MSPLERLPRIKSRISKPTKLGSKKPFLIFEAGVGESPEVIAQRAKESLKKRRNRKFIGVDEQLNLDEVVSKKLKGIKNLELRQSCAIKELLKTPAGSQDIVFASYLTNNLAERNESCNFQGYSCRKAFFIAAEKALRPGGRLILIQDKITAEDIKHTAKELGLEFHIKLIPDEKAINSKSEAVRVRSTPEKRTAFMKERFSDWDLERFLPFWKKDGITSVEDTAKPTIFILKKPRNPYERKIILPDKSFEKKPSNVMRIINEIFGIR
jgi:hypothetical protein